MYRAPHELSHDQQSGLRVQRDDLQQRLRSAVRARAARSHGRLHWSRGHGRLGRRQLRNPYLRLEPDLLQQLHGWHGRFGSSAHLRRDTLRVRGQSDMRVSLLFGYHLHRGVGL